MKKLIVLILSSFILSSCASTSETDAIDVIENRPQDLASFYAQEIKWSGCKEDKRFEYAEILVPIDYENPGNAALTLALKKLPAEDKNNRVGSLLVNPGGPGGSGTDYVTYAEDAFGKRLMQSFDIIGFDPRGVALSTPLDCLTDKEVDEFIAFDGTPDNDQELKESMQLSINLANGCLAVENNLIAHVGSLFLYSLL
jgi:hypothetical protein